MDVSVPRIMKKHRYVPQSRHGELHIHRRLFSQQFINHV